MSAGLLRPHSSRKILSVSLFQVVIYLTGSSNGLRYPRVGGTRERRFAGTNLEPNKLPENAQTPTRRVHAVLGGFIGPVLQILSKNLFLSTTSSFLVMMILVIEVFGDHHWEAPLVLLASRDKSGECLSKESLSG